MLMLAGWTVETRLMIGARLHRHGRGGSQRARRKGAGGASEYPRTPFAPLFSRTQATGTAVGGAAREGISEPRVCRQARGWPEPWKRPATIGLGSRSGAEPLCVALDIYVP